MVALKRQLEEAAADTEEAVQGALAEAHEAFDAEVGFLPSHRALCVAPGLRTAR